ncbi:zinc finger protein 277 [Drosophila grimshawi]|uniref:GH20913 n=1 Tax=Drosophila grimshawi TaxID=7222 RepID=B4J4S1_DROGR|nr:zinc finger protein 277 [Drosophila grimshawi]EDW00617.1 GH20913 [Drosophila grimshawi]
MEQMEAAGIAGDSVATVVPKDAQVLKPTRNTAIKCLKCDKVYIFPGDRDDCLAHLYLEHRLVIADVDEIAVLEDYLQYWEKEFQAHEFEQYCTTMFLDQLPDGSYAKNEKYFLLCDILPQDFELRQRLQEQRLNAALERHQFELTDRSFSKECLFCRTVVKGLRADYLDHLFDKHFLLVGKPEKLVFVDELLDQLEENINKLLCLYCEKIFKDRPTLKEHMRKKGHKRINPNRREYDKFFLVNYNRAKQAPAQRKQQQRAKRRSLAEDNVSVDFDKHFARQDSDGDHDSDWSDWAADGEPHSIKCLYCPLEEAQFSVLKKHMIDVHHLDFDAVTSSLNFYQKIKVVNFIRRQICLLRCICCDLQFDEFALLSDHMQQETHCSIGQRSNWDKPEFFFPYVDNDGLLCVLDDSVADGDLDADVVRIISEDSSAQINKDAEQLSLENFKL